MDMVALLRDRSVKRLEKRERIVEAFRSGALTLRDIDGLVLDDKDTAVVLEAMEAVSRSDPDLADGQWLAYVAPLIASPSGSLKREASRVAGNIACRFPGQLSDIIEKLLENTKNDGTVIRWGSAYALGRILAIPQYANSALYTTVSHLADTETQNGVKSQYLAGLKKAQKLRR